jgi:hypothetical protein
VFNEKLLIYNKRSATKATVIYDLKECDIKGNYIEENFHDKEYLKSVSFIKSKRTEEKVIFSKRRCSENMHGGEEIPSNNKHLTFLIEIYHPYQQVCVLKHADIFEAVELYQILKKIIKLN